MKINSEDKNTLMPSFAVDDELLDLVNEHDQVISQAYRSEIYAKKLNNFRVINAFLINDKQEIWIPRRTAHKKLFPLCLDVSVGGHVAAGESYECGFERELKEELNADLANMNFHLISKLVPAQHNVSAYMHLYLIKSNETPAYNQDDFIDCQWISIGKLQALIANGEPSKGDLPILLNVLQEWLNTNG